MPQVALLGQVNSVRGCHASVGLTGASSNGPEETRATVGKFLGVCANKSLLIGLITDVSLQPGPTPQDPPIATAQLELIGEISNYDSASARFQRGVTTYPAIGDTVTFIGARELRLIFHTSSSRMIDIGHLQLDAAIAARLDVDEMVSKHFAVLGTTGVGKSSAVALLLQQIVEARPDLRFFILDVHNEYSRCFGDRAQILNPSNLKLPFWLFNFDEIVDVFFGGRPGLDEEIDFLSEVIPLAKSMYAQQFSAQGRLSTKSGEVGARYTLDIPVPYRIADLITLLDSRMGKLENRSSRMIYHKLITRIESVCGDPRYAFMFENANVGGDTMAEILATLFRLPPNGKPMTIMQLAGFPVRSGRRRRLGHLPHGVRPRPVERRHQPGAAWCARKRIATWRPTTISASRRPAAPFRGSPKRGANTASFSAWSRSGPPSSTRPSCRNAARCLRCA